MREIAVQITELLDEGLSAISIATILDVPLEMVYDTVDEINGIVNPDAGFDPYDADLL